MKIIYILWLRQMKRYVRKKSRIVGALGQPLLFLFALGFGLNPIYSRAGEGNYFSFLAPGVIVMTVLFTAIFTGMEIIWDKQFGFMKETLVAPVSRFEIMLGKVLGGATVATIQGVMVFVITLVAGFRPANWLMVPVAFLVLILVSFMFSALGTVIAARLDDMQAFPLIINFVVQPLFFLSGALFPIAGLPQALGIVTKINPLSYGVEALRFTLNGTAFLPFLTSIMVLVSVSVVILAVGTYQFSKIEV